jgi:hypothetical protein
MTLTADRHLTAISASAPSTPRLRLEPTGSRHALLDGGWWPHSTDPVAELPGLVLATDRLRGPVTRLVLSAAGWDEHPRRLGVTGRILRLGYFTSQPAALLTALCGHNGDRVDLLVVPRKPTPAPPTRRWCSRPLPATSSTPKTFSSPLPLRVLTMPTAGPRMFGKPTAAVSAQRAVPPDAKQPHPQGLDGHMRVIPKHLLVTP